LFTWKLDATDVSRMAGHANYRITLDMYVGTTAGILARARQGWWLWGGDSNSQPTG
jgi:hypothetical protein